MAQESSPIEYSVYEGPVARQRDDWTCILQSLQNCVLASGGTMLPDEFGAELTNISAVQEGLSFGQLREAVVKHDIPVIISPLASGEQLVRTNSDMEAEAYADAVERNMKAIRHIVDVKDGVLLSIGNDDDKTFHAVCAVGYVIKGDKQFIQILDSGRGSRYLTIEDLSSVVITNEMNNAQMFYRVHARSANIEIIEE